jgi:hypothetical protein
VLNWGVEIRNDFMGGKSINSYDAIIIGGQSNDDRKFTGNGFGP